MDFAPAVELHQDGQRDEQTETEGNQRVEVPDSGGDQRAHQHQGRNPGPLEVAAQAFRRRSPPGEERTHTREEQQEQPDRHHQPVVPIGIERDFVARDGLADHREQRAPQHRETTGQQNQVVEQEARFARNHALQLGLALEVVQPVQDQEDHRRDADGQEADEVLADIAPREARAPIARCPSASAASPEYTGRRWRSPARCSRSSSCPSFPASLPSAETPCR